MVYCSRAVASRQNSLRHLSLRYSVLECNYYVYTQCVCVCACVYVLVLVHVCVQFARKKQFRLFASEEQLQCPRGIMGGFSLQFRNAHYLCSSEVVSDYVVTCVVKKNYAVCEEGEHGRLNITTLFHTNHTERF